MRWGTLKSHGTETGEPFILGGFNRTAPDRHVVAYAERTSPTCITLVEVESGRVLRSFGVASRYWADHAPSEIRVGGED